LVNPYLRIPTTEKELLSDCNTNTHRQKVPLSWAWRLWNGTTNCCLSL